MLPRVEGVLRLVGQLEKAQRVCDRGSILADLLRNLFLAQVGHFHQTSIGKSLLDRGQVFPLYILDERDLELFLRR